MAYLQALGVFVQKVTPTKKNSYERSQEDIREGRIETFSSADEMFESLGIYPFCSQVRAHKMNMADKLCLKANLFLAALLI